MFVSSLTYILFGGCTLRAKRNLFAETKKSIIFITFHKQDTLSLQPNSENNGTESQAEMIYENHVRGGCPHLFPVEPLPTIYIHVSYHSCWSNDHERFWCCFFFIERGRKLFSFNYFLIFNANQFGRRGFIKPYLRYS